MLWCHQCGVIETVPTYRPTVAVAGAGSSDRTAASIGDRLVDQLLDPFAIVAAAGARALRHVDGYQLFLGIDPEVRAADACPF